MGSWKAIHGKEHKEHRCIYDLKEESTRSHHSSYPNSSCQPYTHVASSFLIAFPSFNLHLLLFFGPISQFIFFSSLQFSAFSNLLLFCLVFFLILLFFYFSPDSFPHLWWSRYGIFLKISIIFNFFLNFDYFEF